jgi:hypothetical protein
LNGLQTFFRSPRRASASRFAAVALVCLALLALIAIVQVAHVHSVATDADHCPLCIVLHTAATVAVAVAVIVLVQIHAATPLVEMSAVTWHGHQYLFIRPPPADCQAS